MGEDDGCRDHALAQHRLLAVQVDQQRVEQLGALGEADLERRPRGRVDDEGQRVELPRLRTGIRALNSTRLAWETTSNEVFAVLSKASAGTAEEKGAKFYDWPVPQGMSEQVKDDEMLVRLVTSFATTEEDIDQFLSICRG